MAKWHSIAKEGLPRRAGRYMWAVKRDLDDTFWIHEANYTPSTGNPFKAHSWADQVTAWRSVPTFTMSTLRRIT